MDPAVRAGLNRKEQSGLSAITFTGTVAQARVSSGFAVSEVMRNTGK